MARDKDNYTPQRETAAVLERAYELVKSVPYQVSARWLFYGLLQEGYYTSKDDYKNKFLPAVSRARHANYQMWQPDTLADETRETYVRGDGYTNGTHFLQVLADQVECVLDRWSRQSHYVELWFEARAMADQFRWYTDYITLRPMGGQPSIPYKYRAAKDLEYNARRYGTPIVVLYFGDLDDAGSTIADVVESDVRKWCAVDFEFIHCGLNIEQVQRYNVPENFEKPGTYQWEALPDAAAQEIITGNIRPFLSHAVFDEIAAREVEVTKWLRGKLADLLPHWIEG